MLPSSVIVPVKPGGGVPLVTGEAGSVGNAVKPPLLIVSAVAKMSVSRTASPWPVNSTVGSSTPMSNLPVLTIAPIVQRWVIVPGVLKSQSVTDGLWSSRPYVTDVLATMVGALPMSAVSSGSMSGFVPAAPFGARLIFVVNVTCRRPRMPIVIPSDPVLSERTISCWANWISSADMRQQLEPASVATPVVFGIVPQVVSFCA